MAPEPDAAAELVALLLSDPAMRRRFRDDPAGVAREAGFDEVAETLQNNRGMGIEALEGRESRSNLAGALMAAIVEGVSVSGHGGEALHGGGHLGRHGEQQGARLVADVSEPRSRAQAPIDPHQFGQGGTGGPLTPEGRALLHDHNVTLDPNGVADIRAGRIDPRVIAVMTDLSREHKLTISSTSSDHPRLTAGGSVSNHTLGRAFDIAAIDGKPVGPGNQVARQVALELARLPPSIRPSEIGSPWKLPGAAYFTDAAHQNHLHVGFDDPIGPHWRPPAALAASNRNADAVLLRAVAPPGGAAPGPAADAAAVAGSAAEGGAPPINDQAELGGLGDDESDDGGDGGGNDGNGTTTMTTTTTAAATTTTSAAANDDNGDDGGDGGDDNSDNSGSGDNGDNSGNSGSGGSGNSGSGGSDNSGSGDNSDNSDNAAGTLPDNSGGGSHPAGIDPGIFGSSGYPGDNASPPRIAAWMAAEAQKRGLPPELPLMASLVESGLKNLPGGDADSVGFFQMRVGTWDQGAYAGYPHKPALQLRWFLDEATAVKRQRLAAGEPIDPQHYGDWIADVERPAAQYRYRYQLRLGESRGLLSKAHDLLEHMSGSGAGPVSDGESGRRALEAVGWARHELGVPYAWGGESPRGGFDCSGLMQWAYAKVGISIPRTSEEQILASNGKPVGRHDLLPGDLVFFRDSTGDVHHVGMSLGGDKFIEAPHTGADVRVSSLNDPYYAHEFTGGRRFAPAVAATPAHAQVQIMRAIDPAQQRRAS